MNQHACSRRGFLRTTSLFAAGVPLALSSANRILAAAEASGKSFSDAKVAIAACKTYAPKEVRAAYDQCFDLLGGVGSLVKGKTVTIKINLTGTNFTPFLDRPVGETYMTHPATAHALAAALFKAGAKRVVFVESTQSRSSLESTLALADWDVKALSSLGDVQFENTRNLGSGKKYSHIKVPTEGLMFSSFDVNHRYVDTDVMVSLCKLKNHITAGVTLTMKNMFGITPNSLYGDEAGNENATAGRGPLHNRNDRIQLPGIKEGITSNNAMWRVPRIIVDEQAARPLHLCVIDGITSMSGGEGPWCRNANPLTFTNPGVLIVGLNGVSTDAVGTAVMGYPDPRVVRGTKPFGFCDNHLLMAEQAGLGTADLSKIDVRGLLIEKVKYPYNI
ncbi:DUF362 domain-containing protein [bacterium]|nr:DUF362 domain-containing protein [bacterium]